MNSIQTINNSTLTQSQDYRKSVAVQEFISLAQNQVWDISILGQAPMPTKSIRLQDWQIVPADQDTSPIPNQAMDRIQAVFQAGIKPKGFVIVHEAPMLLPAPEVEKTPFLETIDWPAVGKATGNGIVEIAKVTGTVVGAIASGLLSTVFMGLALLDPILIAVTEDDYWVELYRWYD